ncbi:DUF2851 family protein [Croceitalea marina]|uniref:DUF2851 family protein n=1 Tax=Croceitalea marina TaxID=1775166 RepID=A0ABW5MSK2_9FLAO
MREDLLHFIWKTKKLPLGRLETSKKEPLIIHGSGLHNQNAGPDFFNAQIEINGQLWAGNVEIHLKASDWYAHNHETDPNYDNVILHVVWEHDVAVFRKDNSEIATLELKNYISPSLLEAYMALMDNPKRKFINCEKDFKSVNQFQIENWLERLYIERLESKSALVFTLLKQSNNDWEQVLFSMLLKNFGTTLNGNAFLSISEVLDFSVVRKLQNSSIALESLFFGMANLLEDQEVTDEYYQNHQKEFNFLRTKFQLNNEQVLKLNFFGLRPNNFPTLRLSQLANLYSTNHHLFSKLIEVKNVDEIYALFDLYANSYWDTHFTFGKESKPRKKKLTKNFIDLIIINTIIPIKFSYAKSLGKTIDDTLFLLMRNLKPEKNSIIEKYDSIGSKTKNAFESQSKLQLYNQYCKENKCLQCSLGMTLLNENG